MSSVQKRMGATRGMMLLVRRSPQRPMPCLMAQRGAYQAHRLTKEGQPPRVFVPVDFTYTVGGTAPPPPPPPPPPPSPPPGGHFVTSVTGDNVRNSYAGWVGMKITVGNNDLVVSQLGRWVRADNTNSHTIKIVSVATGADIGSVNLKTMGQSA